MTLLIVAFGMTTTWQLSEQRNATNNVPEHSQQLSAGTASIHRSLAHANTMVSAEFLVERGTAGEEREQYEQDIRTVSELLTRVSANPGVSQDTREQITRLNQGLPRSTGLVETARANRSTDLPVGGTHLQYPHGQMTSELLPGEKALALMVKPDGSSGSAYGMTDTSIWEAFEHEQREFRAASGGHTGWPRSRQARRC